MAKARPTASVLAVFRLFAALQLMVVGSTAVAFFEHESPRHARAAMITMAALLSALCILLWSRTLVARLGRVHLPLALGVAFVTPVLGEGLALLQSEAAFAKLSAEVAFSLFVPLILVAWQYGFPLTVGIAAFTGGADFILSAAASLGGEQMESVHHVVIGRTAAFLLSAYVVARLASEQRSQHDSLQRAYAELSRAALTLEQLTITRERNRMARELHDTLAHTLSGLAVQLEAVRSLWSNSEEAHAMLERALAVARSGLTETRRALLALRASPLDDLGLTLALHHLSELAAARAGLTLELTLPQPTLDLSPEIEQGLYRVAQEAIENVIRHAAARRLWVSLQRESHQLVLSVADDGRGFDTAQIPAGRFGLQGLAERAALIGGALDIQSRQGAGTKVRLVMELPSEQAPAVVSA